MPHARERAVPSGSMTASSLKVRSPGVGRWMTVGMAMVMSVTGATAAAAGDGSTEVIEGETPIRELVYPVDGPAWFDDSWLAPRSGGPVSYTHLTLPTTPYV